MALSFGLATARLAAWRERRGDGRVRMDILLCGVVLCVSETARGGPGDLDPGFGSGGKIVGPSDIVTSNLVLEPDGGILLAALFPSEDESSSKKLLFLRYDATGQPDSNFGINGYLTTAPLGFELSSSRLTLLRQPDGKWVVAGKLPYLPDTSIASGIWLARFDSSGALDPMFGVDGVATTNFQIGDQSRRGGLVRQSDGKLAFGGPVTLPRSAFGIVRFTADGKLDESYGDGGLVMTSFGALSSLTAVAIQSDDKIVAVGDSLVDSDFFTPHLVMLTRYNQDGSLDESFGDGGIVRMFDALTYALLPEPDGRILVGANHYFDDTIIVWALSFLPNGNIDPDFGSDGIGEAVLSDIYTLARQENGRLLLGGRVAGKFAVARLDPDGTPDRTFAADGVATVGGIGGPTDVNSVVVQPDGKILASGRAVGSLMIARFNGDPPNEPLPTKPAATATKTPTPSRIPTRTRTLTRTRTATRTPTRGISTRTPVGAVTATPTRAPLLPGDANCDALLTSQDVRQASIVIFDSSANLDCDADCNQDGIVSAADVLCVMESLADGEASGPLPNTGG